MIEARKGNKVPMQVLMRKFIKHWCRHLDLHCVAFPNYLPAGTRTDLPIEGDE